MGLLDDAIREHLELKRRRGADSSEVARQEQEAFGPPRRGDLEPAHDPVEDAPRSLQAVEEPVWDDDGGDEPEPEPATRVLSRVEPAEEQHVVDEEPEPESEPAPAAPAGPPPRGSLAEEGGQPTREFDAHEIRAATEVPPRAPDPEPAAPPEPAPSEPAPRADEEADEEADVLEETPEFLQETPEHDRLWFEQRPPRDFDF